MTFSDVVNATDELTAEEQETLLELLRRRLADRKRAQLARDVAEGRAEYASGRAKRMSVNEIMDEAGGES